MDHELDEVISLLQDEDLPLPIEELSALSDLDSRGLDQFSTCWQSLSLMRRRTLLATLGQQADEHVELFFDNINELALNDPDPTIRKIAISNLWESTDLSLLNPYLATLKEDDSDEVRAAAANALGSFILLAELGDAPENMSNEIVDSLLATIHSTAPLVLHCSCVESLGYSSRSDAQATIADAYNSGDEALIQSALLAMGRSANPVWRPEILQELQHPSPQVRGEAARASGELELHDAVQPLVELLEDVSGEVARVSIWSLGQIGGDAAKAALLEFQASEPDQGVSESVNEALEHLAFLEGTPDLLIFDFEDPSEDSTD